MKSCKPLPGAGGGALGRVGTCRDVSGLLREGAGWGGVGRGGSGRYTMGPGGSGVVAYFARMDQVAKAVAPRSPFLGAFICSSPANQWGPCSIEASFAFACSGERERLRSDILSGR